MFSISRTAIVAFSILSILSLPATLAQFVSSLPQCVQDCIDQSQDDNCEVTDIKCLCRASAGNFLPDLITCMHGNCDNDLDNNLLLTPLQLACTIAGVPIPAAALRNAENEASSLATQVTTTVTKPGPPGGPGPATTTTVAAGTTISTATVTTTQSGTTYYEIYPITILSTTTVSGPASTQTVYSGGSSSSVSLSTAISSSSNTNTDTTTTTSVAAQATTSSQSISTRSSTSSASKPGQTDSAPFTDTNHNGARAKEGINVWLWTGMLATNCLIWF